MQMAGCELAQPGGCRRSCCVAHPKPESDEDDERSATPEPSAHPTVRELKCQCEEAGISTDRMLERPKLEDALTNDKASKKRRTATPRSAPAKPPASHPKNPPLHARCQGRGWLSGGACRGSAEARIRPGMGGSRWLHDNPWQAYGGATRRLRAPKRLDVL